MTLPPNDPSNQRREIETDRLKTVAAQNGEPSLS